MSINDVTSIAQASCALIMLGFTTYSFIALRRKAKEDERKSKLPGVRPSGPVNDTDRSPGDSGKGAV